MEVQSTFRSPFTSSRGADGAYRKGGVSHSRVTVLWKHRLKNVLLIQIQAQLNEGKIIWRQKYMSGYKNFCWQALTSFPSLWTMLMYSSLEQCLALWLELPDTWQETLLSWMFLMPTGTIGLDTDTATHKKTNLFTDIFIWNNLQWLLFHNKNKNVN